MYGLRSGREQAEWRGQCGCGELGSVRVAGEGQRWRRRRRERKAERKEWCWNEESGSKWGEVWVGVLWIPSNKRCGRVGIR